MKSNSSDRDIENLLLIIANLPDFLKLSVCRTKAQELVEMTEAEKKESIVRSLNSVNLIDQDRLVSLTRTWMTVISEIEPDELTEILHCYLLILESVNLFNKIDPKLILNTFFSLEEDQRNKLIVCLKEALFLNPNMEHVLKNIPKNLAKVIFN
jgi:predicted ABC-type exoprotein transport system permease subunit